MHQLYAQIEHFFDKLDFYYSIVLQFGKTFYQKEVIVLPIGI